MNYLAVFLGAGIGGSLRYWISSVSHKFFPVYFPSGTLIVNLLGSFMLGFIMFGLDDKRLISPWLKLFLGVGLCGGFTTFSTFSFETFNLLRDSQFILAAANIAANLFLTLLGVFIAYQITR